jgi:hypothetical protein
MHLQNLLSKMRVLSSFIPHAHRYVTMSGVSLFVQLVPALHADMVAADATLGVEQGRRQFPRAVDLDLFEELDRAKFGHVGTLGGSVPEPPIDSPIRGIMASRKLYAGKLGKRPISKVF